MALPLRMPPGGIVKREKQPVVGYYLRNYYSYINPDCYCELGGI